MIFLQGAKKSLKETCPRRIDVPLVYCLRSPFAFGFIVDNPLEAILGQSRQMSRNVGDTTLGILLSAALRERSR